MHIASAEIRDFRGIRQLSLDLADSFGRIRPLTLMAGPNASGKTTVLDALAVAVGPLTGLFALRPDWDLQPSTVIRRGSLRAAVTCHIRFAPDEIEAVRELSRLAGETATIPDSHEVTVEWVYPDPEQTSRLGRHKVAQPGAWRLFRGRRLAADLMNVGSGSAAWFQRVGGVFTFDQQRVATRMVVDQKVWNYLNDLPLDFQNTPEDRATNDLRTVLATLATDDALDHRFEGPGTRTMFQDVQEVFNRICAPHRITGAERTKAGVGVRFRDGDVEYGFDGLSSGQKAVLLFLVRMVRERMHQCIVLIDEVELHQHPLWQRQLVHALPAIGEQNQIIATTHSDYLRDLLPATVVLGELGAPEASPEEAPSGDPRRL